MAECLRKLLFFAFLVLLPFAARADNATFGYVEIAKSEEGYALNASVDFDLNARLIDALNRGVALYFVAELRIESPRWYWFDKLIVHRRLEYRLSWHAITRTYRLNIGGLHRSFDTLEEAVRTIRHVRNLHIASPRKFKDDVSYEVVLRFFHDTTQLPKPFQLSALTNGVWNVDTGWVDWRFTTQTVSSPAVLEGSATEATE